MSMQQIVCRKKNNKRKHRPEFLEAHQVKILKIYSGAQLAEVKARVLLLDAQAQKLADEGHVDASNRAWDKARHLEGHYPVAPKAKSTMVLKRITPRLEAQVIRICTRS